LVHKLLLLTVLALQATGARAGNGLFYLGAGATSSKLTDDTVSYLHTDLNNTSWKAFVGVRPFKWVAMEADYIDLGSGSNFLPGNSFSTTHADASAWTAYAVGFLPIPLPVVDFYGKAGIARWKLNSSLSFTSYIPGNSFADSTSSTGTDFAWGIGVQAHISIVGARLEYEQFNVNSNAAKVASLSVFLNL
jgi:opacity protein-like surface antigen